MKCTNCGAEVANGHAVRISVRRSGEKGRGVFAEKRFARGEVIEKCVVLVVPVNQVELAHQTMLSDYVFPWGDDEQEAALPLGFGLLYNHSYAPNADWFQNYEEQTQTYIAVRDIEAGEEITVNYNGPIDDHTPVWFDVVD